MPRSCAPELRRRVTDLIVAGKTVAEVAEMVDPTEQTIYNWWNRHLVDTGRKPGASEPTSRLWNAKSNSSDEPTES